MSTAEKAKKIPEEQTLFKQLYALLTPEMVSTMEVRGGIDFVEWAEAWKNIKEFDGNASFEIIETADGLPFFDSKYGVFVKVRVTVGGQTVTEIYAVDDDHLNAQVINNAHQRALVKALGRLGFGLQLWIKDEREKLKKQRLKGSTPTVDPTEWISIVLKKFERKKTQRGSDYVTVTAAGPQGSIVFNLFGSIQKAFWAVAGDEKQALDKVFNARFSTSAKDGKTYLNLEEIASAESKETKSDLLEDIPF